MSLQELLVEPEDKAAKLKNMCQFHANLADKVHHLYMDNAMAGTYQEPFDAELKEYGKRQSETHEQYCNRLLMKSEELREQALEEDKEAANVEAEVIPQIVCDYQCGQRRRTASMKRPNPFGGMSPFTEPEELHFRNPV
ncbi:hypothetical protein EMMF5_003022 [Cystobasidiomycetes sp. EMM_F5]